jgi:hypothetical protein
MGDVEAALAACESSGRWNRTLATEWWRKQTAI